MKYVLNVLWIIVFSMPAFSENFSTSAYSMEYKNWFKTNYPTMDVMLLAPKNSTGTYHENISILKKVYPYKSVSDWETIKKYQVEALQKAVGDFKLLAWDACKLDSTEGRKIQYTGSYANLKLQWMQIYVLKNGTWYVVSYVGDQGNDFTDYLKEAMDIISSFKFK